MNHNHAFFVTSAHRTSEGVIRYLTCSCGAHRIDLGGLEIARPTTHPAVELRA